MIPVEDPARRVREDAARRVWYPESKWSIRAEPHGAFTTLRAVIQPFPPADEVHAVLADLIRGERVDLQPYGRLRHNPACRRSHVLPVAIKRAALNLTERFTTEATFYDELSDPRVRILDPVISRAVQSAHPHFYDVDVVCPLFSGDRTWSWQTHLITDYLDHIAAWIVKSRLWAATGIWIGPDTRHDPRYLLATLSPWDRCSCGSGRQYGEHCQPIHIAAIRGRA